MKEIQIKRIYEDVSMGTQYTDGTYRILIDRLWPRGISKEEAKLDEWNKEIAPSNELRKWFDHREERFVEFSLRYKKELIKHEDDLNRLVNISATKNLLLLYGAKNKDFNQAVVLQRILKELRAK